MCLIRVFFFGCFLLVTGFSSSAIDIPDGARIAPVSQVPIVQIEQKIVADKDFIPEEILQEFIKILDERYVGDITVSKGVISRLHTELFRLQRAISFFDGVLKVAGAMVFLQSFFLLCGAYEFRHQGPDIALWPIGGAWLYGFIKYFENKAALIESILIRIR